MQLRPVCNGSWPDWASSPHPLPGVRHTVTSLQRLVIYAGAMTDSIANTEKGRLLGDYEPSTWEWVRDQVETYEASNGAEANTLRDSGIPIIVFTTRGRKSGKLRKVPLMRVEHNGDYALIASKGGAPEHPGWFHNLMADAVISMQDGPEPFLARAELVSGEERQQWWDRGVEVFPTYAEYAEKTDRDIPVFVTRRL